MRVLFLAALLACAAGGAAADPLEIAAAPRESAKLRALYDVYWEAYLADNPGTATFIGDRRYDDRIYDISEKAYLRRFRRDRRFLQRADRIDFRSLSEQERIGLDVLRRRLRLAIEGESLHSYLDENYLLPLNQMEGLHVRVLGLPNSHPFETVRDYDNYAARLHAVPRQVDAAIANMRKGMRLRIVQPRAIVERVIPQLDAGIVSDATKSVLHEPVTRFPESIDAEERARLTASIDREIASSIAPSFRSLQKFMRDEYLPAARATYAVSDLPRGRELFAYAIRVRTTTAMTADDVEALGRAELERAEAERARFVKEIGFEGTPLAYAQKLQADPTLRWHDAAEVERDVRENLDFIIPLLPRMFVNLPSLEYQVRQVEPYRAASFPNGAYVPGSADGRRAPTYYVNTFNVKTEGVRKFMLPDLSFHEVFPGHQFQRSKAEMNAGLHPFRRYAGNDAYNEGWAAYAEGVADELGAFRDPAARNFYLSARVFNAVSLVAEVGVHARGWSRERAYAFVREHLPMPEERFDVFMARWAALPAQGFAYPVGALTIRALRERAENELGAAFDVREFHEVVLSNGNVPIDVLTGLVDSWIAVKRVR